MDELGVPFSVTVDFQTVEDSTVTLRERDSMTQVRMPLAEVAPLVEQLVEETATWKVGTTIDCSERDGFSCRERETGVENGYDDILLYFFSCCEDDTKGRKTNSSFSCEGLTFFGLAVHPTAF